VTQKVPPDFPSAEKTATRREYDPPPGWTSPTGASRKGAPKKAGKK